MDSILRVRKHARGDDVKKRTWIIAALFAVEVAAIALFFWTQRDVVHTVKNTPNSYTAETADGPYQPPKKVHDIVRDLTEEEKEALHTGQMTQEALIAALTGTATGAGIRRAHGLVGSGDLFLCQ